MRAQSAGLSWYSRNIYCCGAQLFPCADFVRTGSTGVGMLFERGPFFGRAVEKNPFAIVCS